MTKGSRFKVGKSLKAWGPCLEVLLTEITVFGSIFDPASILATAQLTMTIHSVLPPCSNSWIIFIIKLYTALNRTPNIDCSWVGAVPKPYTL